MLQFPLDLSGKYLDSYAKKRNIKTLLINCSKAKEAIERTAIVISYSSSLD
jgi:hypothetical protein